MRVIDPGHVYELAVLDSASTAGERLHFVKREGVLYPGNVGHHSGTTMQEVLRVLIDRVKYLDRQLPSDYNAETLAYLRCAIYSLELRAAERHRRKLVVRLADIENRSTCPKCLHIGCEGECK